MAKLDLHGVEAVLLDDGLRSIAAGDSSVIGIVGTAPNAKEGTPFNTPILLDGWRAANDLGTTGTLRDAYMAAYAQGVKTVVAVVVPEGATPAQTLSNVVGDAGQFTGCHALRVAENRLGLAPKILCAPGFTKPTTRTDNAFAKNPVADCLTSIGQDLRAIVIADGPNTNEADAVAYRDNFGAKNVMLIDPHVTTYDTTLNASVVKPASGYVAGRIARNDVEKGYWWSVSNSVILGIDGTARPIDFKLSSRDTEANRLNRKEVATIVRRNGFRVWGNRSTSADQLWKFLCVIRTDYVIRDAIEGAMLWAMDRPITGQLINDIRDSVQIFGDGLVSRGALLGFNCWLDPEMNSKADLANGKLFLDYDFEPPAPLEHLTFRGRRNGDYYDDLVSQVAI
ncbi:MAG: phage tail sheath subtilisin-like domain-containing protein [Planktomarina sp.]